MGAREFPTLGAGKVGETEAQGPGSSAGDVQPLLMGISANSPLALQHTAWPCSAAASRGISLQLHSPGQHGAPAPQRMGFQHKKGFFCPGASGAGTVLLLQLRGWSLPSP